MKKSLMILAGIAFCISLQAQSILKTSPIALAFGVFNACYEKPISDKASVQFTGSAFFGIGDLDGVAVGLGADYRMYMSKTKDAPHGFYISPGVGVSFGDGANALQLRVPIGYQWVWDSGFVLDLGLGPAYWIGFGDDIIDEFNGILPTGTLAIGYQF